MALLHFLNALLLLQFSIALAHIHIPPAAAPLPSHHGGSHSPSPSPIFDFPPPPTSQPFPRLKIAIQGVVYCKSCKYIGVDTLLDAKPLPGAIVQLRCGFIRETTKTDENGYFFFMPPNLTLFLSQRCKVFLVSSPSLKCSVATNLHGGARGARPLSFSRTTKPQPFLFLNFGPFAFEPRKKLACH